MINKYELPEFDEIINLEKKSNKDGSGLTFKELNGYWKLKYVWKKGSEEKDNILSSLLQVLCASLELSNLKTKDNKDIFEIQNSIKFGFFSIVFTGKAFLKGSRPLLMFYFERFSLKIGKYNLIKNNLEKIDNKKMPFFSLIAIARNKYWMCARGKGGGLAIWTKY